MAVHASGSYPLRLVHSIASLVASCCIVIPVLGLAQETPDVPDAFVQFDHCLSRLGLCLVRSFVLWIDVEKRTQGMAK